MTYGEKIIQLRKNANMTQAELGERLGVTAQAVSKWEHDISEPDLGTMRKMATIFGISTDDFLDAEHDVLPATTAVSNAVAAQITPVVAESVREGFSEQTSAVTAAVARAGDAVLGSCTACGVVVNQKNKGQLKPKVLCANCLRKKIAAKAAAARQAAAQAEEKKAQLRSKRNRCLFWGMLAGLLFLAGAVGVAVKLNLSVGARVGVIIAGLWAGYAVLGVICEVFLSDSAVSDVMSWCLSRSISWPGVIFTLDFGGIMFLIAVKILFAILGFLAGAALFFLGLSVSMVIATFTFPSTMRRVRRKLNGELPLDDAGLV